METVTKLSAKEMQVMQYYALGHTGPEIAKFLGRAKHTVGTHYARIMTKMNWHSRADLIQYCWRNGLVK